MEQPACIITRYDCDKDGEKIKELIDLANEQQDRDHGFISIFPWLGGCDLAPRHYVAQKTDKTICGWMTVIPRAQGKYKFFYLSEISVIRTPDPSFRGVGLRLQKTLVEDAKKEDQDFIYLFPLTSDVAKTYMEKWGYQDLGSKHLFYIVKQAPPKYVIDKLSPEPSHRQFTVQAREIVRGDPEAVAIIEKKRRDVEGSPATLAQLEETINTISTLQLMADEGEEVEDIDTMRQWIVDVYKRAPEFKGEALPGGRRKTRRQTKRRRTQRKRKHRLSRKV